MSTTTLYKVVDESGFIKEERLPRKFFLMNVNFERESSMETNQSFKGNPLFLKIISKGLLGSVYRQLNPMFLAEVPLSPAYS